MRAVVRTFDRFLCHLQGVFVFWDDPGCMFRAQITQAPHTIVLPPAVIPAGEKVLGLHFWNEQMPQIPPEGPSLRLAIQARRMIVSSFQVLAQEMLRDPRMEGVKALGGVTVLFAAGDGSGAEKLFTRLGFTMFPRRNALGRFGEFWENFYTWALMWTYNPGSLEQRRLLALRRTEAWMTSEKFLRKYGTAGAPALRQEPPQPHEASAREGC